MSEEIDIINGAIDQYKPFKVFALFSGGDDSVCSAHLASQAKQFDGCVFIDTGIKIQLTLDHARAVAKQFGWPFRVVATPESYDEWVLAHGFPGPDMHKFMYNRLKERAIEKLFRETKTKRNQTIMLVTGMRSFESKRRLRHVIAPVVRQNSKIWVAPMWQWTSEIKQAYAEAHQLPKNPVKQILHISGDCLCGAYNDKGDMELLRIFFPVEAARIDKLQAEVKKTHPWGWDEQPPRWYGQYRKGQEFLSNEFMPLCWKCERNH